MRTIEISEKLFSFLASQRIDFETPNDVLERLLFKEKQYFKNNKELTGEKNYSGKETYTNNNYQKPTNNFKIKRKRKRATSLSELVKHNYLSENEILYLHDFRKERVENETAVIEGDKLKYSDGQLYSMSYLAQKLLRKLGEFKTERLQGPAFWFTKEGKSIKEIWDKYLSNNNEVSHEK